MRLARLTVVAGTVAAIVAAPGVAAADPDCGTDAPYGINTTMQQRTQWQTASGTARTSNWFELAVDGIGDQINDLFGGDQ